MPAASVSRSVSLRVDLAAKGFGGFGGSFGEVFVRRAGRRSGVDNGAGGVDEHAAAVGVQAVGQHFFEVTALSADSRN